MKWRKVEGVACVSVKCHGKKYTVNTVCVMFDTIWHEFWVCMNCFLDWNSFCQWCMFCETSQEFKKFVEWGCNQIRCGKHFKVNRKQREKETEMYWFRVVVSMIFYFHSLFKGKITQLTNIFSDGLKPATSDLCYNIRFAEHIVQHYISLCSIVHRHCSLGFYKDAHRL